MKISKTEFKRSKKIRSILVNYWPLYLMMLPGIIWYIIFRYGPMYGLIVSFKDFNITKGIINSPWADPWYKHFQFFFNSPYFSTLMTNTLLISLYKIVFGMIPPIVLALFLNECRVSWYKRLVQTLSYMPHFLSWVIIYGILTAFLSESSGILNKFIVDHGGQAISFLTSNQWFRSILIASDVWQNAGWGAIIYLAAISAIDPSIYESAKIDGCGRIRMMWAMTIPNIRNIIVMLLILRLGNILDAGFEQIYIFYNVRVYSSGDIIDTWVFRTGLEQMNFSLGAAVGLFKSVIGFGLVLASNKLSRKWGEGIW